MGLFVGNNGPFLRSRKHTFWPPPKCQGPLSMLSRYVLSSIMVWNAGVGLWWAATAEIFKSHHPLAICHKKSRLWSVPPSSNDGGRLILKCGKSLCVSQPKGVPTPDLHPRPPDLHAHNIIANTPSKLMVWGGAFGNPLPGREFLPAHLGTLLHKLSVQGCLVCLTKAPDYLKAGLFSSFYWEQGFDKVLESSRTLKPFEGFRRCAILGNGPLGSSPHLQKFPFSCMFINNFRGKKHRG